MLHLFIIFDFCLFVSLLVFSPFILKFLEPTFFLPKLFGVGT